MLVLGIPAAGKSAFGKSALVKAFVIREMAAGPKAVLVASCDGSRYSPSVVKQLLRNRVERRPQ
jgi:hypothetical protein